VCVWCNSYVDDDAKFRDVFQLRAEQLPDGLLVVPLSLVERLVVVYDVRPTAFQRERRRSGTLLAHFIVIIISQRCDIRRREFVG